LNILAVLLSVVLYYITLIAVFSALPYFRNVIHTSQFLEGSHIRESNW